VGANCRGFVNRSAIGVGVWRFVDGGEHGGAIRDGGSTSLPSFRSRNGGETLRAAIIHYMATSARLQWWGWLFRYAIGRISVSSTPAYKGAWRGHHDGTRADTIWSPRLSPIRVLQGNPSWACLRIRHKLLRLVSVMGFLATEPPGRQSAIPPPWATLACWFRTTSLVYPFGIFPTSSDNETTWSWMERAFPASDVV
jgi:hypothetical protein